VARPRRQTNAAPIDLLLHALGDPTRRRIVELLGTRPYAVTALAADREITLTAVGQHIRVLEDAGLVASSKLGRVRSCQLDSKGLAVLQEWLTARRSTWENRLEALGAILARQEEGEP
jgi:DNA-binding transcriptional ArsR family regulator